MTDPSLTSIPAHPLGSTPGIRPVYPQRAPSIEKCETVLHIGVFFDGTGNNMDAHLPNRQDSNVARLFRAYPDRPELGFYRAYVPGLGTPFPEIGEENERSLGAGFGAGGDARLNFGLLHVFNSIHRATSPTDRPYAPTDAVKALCRNGRRTHNHGGHVAEEFSPLKYRVDEVALRRVGMETVGGLLLDQAGKAPQRTSFFVRAASAIARKVTTADKPKPIEIFIDVFGFSRGAAEARTFCTWLLEIFDGEALCGIPASFRFVGLFDSVASVGLPASAGRYFHGHASWGNAHFLRISPRVKNCVHFIAMHENRGSFPAELVRIDGVLPGNCQEFMFPGMHSDVGGGYEPGEQGRGIALKESAFADADQEKLSQIPLLTMYRAAQAARVPLDKTLAVNEHGDPFAVADNLVQAFNAFMATRQSSRRVRDWLFEYLVWRYQVRNAYASLPWYERTRLRPKDRQDLVGANQRLLDDVAALSGTEPSDVHRTDPHSVEAQQQQVHDARVQKLEPEAREIYEKVKVAPPTPAAAAFLFAEYVHDSYAGFRPFDQVKIFGWDPVPGSWEPQGYFRWRRRYEGTNRRYSSLIEPNPVVSSA